MILVPAAKKPAAPRYWNAKMIAEHLACSKRRAYEYLHMFELQGKAFRDAGLIRVREDVFLDYLKSVEGRGA